jgi:hypothetical protein
VAPYVSLRFGWALERRNQTPYFLVGSYPIWPRADVLLRAPPLAAPDTHGAFPAARSNRIAAWLSRLEVDPASQGGRPNADGSRGPVAQRASVTSTAALHDCSRPCLT